ncbi:unnamed protein product [Sphagnum jensenii]|uniref:Ubiquitin-specific protease family C19-related protein n=1 Tax=Sphagnum jensenii TaxID=128206 RepID=A0ABP0VPQ8_9BRYO
MAPAASSSNTGKSSSAGRGVAAHQLSNGLYVSGTAERNSKDSKAHRMGVSQMPYTGGNILDSGEIGKMLKIQATTPTPTTHNNNAAGNKKTRSSSPSCQESRSCPASPSAQSNLRSSSFNAAYTSHINNPFTSPTIIHCNSSNSNSHSRSHSHSSRTTPFIPARGMTGSQSPSLAATGLITGLAASGSGRKANVVVLGNGTTQLQNESHTSATTTTATAASPSPGNSSRTLLASPGASFDRTHGSGQNHGAVATGSVPNNNNSNESVNNLSHVKNFSFMKSIPRLILWSIFSLFVILFAIGAFVLEAAKSVVVLVVVGVLLALVCALLAWNSWWGRQSLLSFVGHHPQSDLRNAKDGQMVCITGVVTCGSLPLESSYQRVKRCAYISTSLYEYRGYNAKKARDKHRHYTWGLRHLERYAVEFYLSDCETGLRVLVKAGHNAHVIPDVEENTVLDINAKLTSLPIDFLNWLNDRNLSADDRIMRLKEGYVKEGSTVRVMGILQRHENVLMIVPPTRTVTTGCQWLKVLLPAPIDGIILKCTESEKATGIPV